MSSRERRTAYACLWVFALAFGWIEASVVVYLRETAVRESVSAYIPNLQVPLVSVPAPLVALEMAREACTLVLLGAVGWLAGRRPADRIGAFLLSFGIWDVTYYAVLRLVSGWPESVSTWDILFLIPSPWVAPVWAPVTVATLFALGGSYLFWTADRGRPYRWADIGVLVASVCLTVAAFLLGYFPLWLFWTGVGLGIGWFVGVERRALRGAEKRRPWVGVRVRTAAPTPAETSPAARIRIPVREGRVVGRPEESNVGGVIAEYRAAKNRLDDLVNEAGECAERFERLAHGLSARPGHLIVGLPEERVENPSEWDIVPSHPLPSIEHLATLTDDIRSESVRVEELRERLILMGRADLVQQPNGFFH
jgi:hypothetical protein